MWRFGHTDAVEQGLLRPLLGQTVVGLDQVVLGSKPSSGSDGAGTPGQLSLRFTLADGRQYELGEYSLFVDRDAPRPQFFPSRIDPERLASYGPDWEQRGRIWTMPIPDLDPSPPWTVAAISEVWAPGESGEPGAELLALICWGEATGEDPMDRPALLALNLSEELPCSLAAVRVWVERATLWFPRVIHRLYDPPPRQVWLMADYTESPLWARDPKPGLGGSIYPEDLPLQSETRARLFAWAATYNREWAYERTRPPIEETRAAFEAEGIALWRILREELGGRYEVSYYSERQQRLIADPSDL